MDTATILIDLIKHATEEINAYRQRQLTTFREAVIVLALITWGVSQLGLQSNNAGWIIRALAGLACLYVGWVGKKIIMSYKNRIYHIRDSRSQIAQQLYSISSQTVQIPNIFYPTSGHGVEKSYETTPTSTIYSYVLLTLGFLGCIINLIAGLAMN